MGQGRDLPHTRPHTRLPAGTVTFLLTDVEQSSRIWEQGDATTVEKAIARMYEILHEAIARHGGARPLEQGEGDSVVGAFARASDAVAAALDAQRMLTSEDWPTSEPVRVRMAIHTGEAQVRDDKMYVGPALNRCARLRELAHGGQVLVSRATHDLVADRVPEGVSLRDMGSHRLRDLGRPEQVFQLCHAELEADFSPLLSLDARPHNLPPQLTTFIGRDHEIEAVRQLIGSERLVTLTGAGGSGKTRLSLQVAAALLDDYPDGVWWIDLAALAEPGLVPNAVGAAMGIREVPREPFSSTLERVLAARRTLVLLDNCEHLIESCATLCDALLRACPELTVMATSREPLGVEGETTWRVPSLTLPMPTEEAGALNSEAVRLFVDRGQRARPTFALTDDNAGVVAQICRRLDGIPLAIELAAARIRVLTPEQIAAGLDDRFRLLTGGARTAMPRQRTLEASVDWSHDLLDEPQRTLFRRLSVFAGSFSLSSAEAVCSGDGIEGHQVFDLLIQLVDRSLVQVEEETQRYRLLETIRQYARYKLVDAGEADSVRSRHLAHYTEFAERVGPLIQWGNTLEATERFEGELDNLRAAMEWASTSRKAATGLQIATAAPLYWFMKSRFTEWRRRMETLKDEADADPELRATTLIALSQPTFVLGDFESAKEYVQRGLALAREIGDHSLETYALTSMGAMMTVLGDEGAAAVLADGLELAQESGNEFCASWASVYLGGTRLNNGDTLAALSILDEAVESSQASGSLFWLCGALAIRAGAYLIRGRLADAERDLGEGRDIAAALGDQWWGKSIAAWLGMVVGWCGDPQTGRELIDEALHDAKETGNIFAFVSGKVHLAWMERSLGDYEATATAAEEVHGLLRSIGLVGHFLAPTLSNMAWAEMRRGNLKQSAALLDEALETSAGLPGIGLVFVTHALLARERGEITEAEDIARRCLAEVGPENIATADALELLGGALGLLGEHEDGVRLLGASEALRRRTGLVRWKAEEPRYEADVAALREALGDEAFTKAWDEGAAMSAEDAVAYATRGRGKRGRPATGWDSLTPTELDVVRFVAEGLTNPQIAEKLFVSPRTVQSHLRRIFPKLGVSTRAELAARAVRAAP